MVLLTFSSGSNYSTHGSMLIIRTSGCFFVETFTMVACSMCAAAFASLLLERISMIRRSFSSTATFIPRHPIALRNCDRSKLYALPFAERASSGVMSEFYDGMIAFACRCYPCTVETRKGARKKGSKIWVAETPLEMDALLLVIFASLVTIQSLSS